MLIVGLTGGFKTGKSTVASMFHSLGAKVIDADQISHQLLQEKGEYFKPIVKEFGSGILAKRRIDRRILGKIVFQDAARLKRLTRIIHPAVKREIMKRIKILAAQNVKIVVLDVPLLFEAKFDRLCDVSIVVTASLAQQLKRGQKQFRMNKDEALRRMDLQMPLKEKVRLADLIIDNNKTKNITLKQVKEIWQKQLQKKRK